MHERIADENSIMIIPMFVWDTREEGTGADPGPAYEVGGDTFRTAAGSRCELIHPLTLRMWGLPPALEGLTMLHIGDLHAHRPRRRFAQLVEEVRAAQADLLVLTGDYMHAQGDEPLAMEVLERIVEAGETARAAVGVFGNHDSLELRGRAKRLPVRWLENHAWGSEDLPLTILGVDCGWRESRPVSGDLAAAALDEPDDPERERVRLLLCHLPTYFPAAGLAQIMFSGHTHGGQIRLPGGCAVYNATPDWPLRLSSGVLRSGKSRCVITRGLGESTVLSLRLRTARILCPPHAPLLTLRGAEQARGEGPLRPPPSPAAAIVCEHPW